MGFSGGSDGKEYICSARDPGWIPALGRSPGGRHGNPLQYSCLENPHGQRGLAGYSPRGHEELDMTERLTQRRASCPRWPRPPRGPASRRRGPAQRAVPGGPDTFIVKVLKLVWAASSCCLRFTSPWYRMTARSSWFLPDPYILSPACFSDLFPCPPLPLSYHLCNRSQDPFFPAPHIAGCPLYQLTLGALVLLAPARQNGCCSLLFLPNLVRILSTFLSPLLGAWNPSAWPLLVGH